MKGYLFCVGLIVFFPARALASIGERECWPGWGHMAGFGSGGMFMWILLLIAVVLIVYSLTRVSRGGGPGASPHETALDILKKRYAQGEITKEQFDEMKNDLKG